MGIDDLGPLHETPAARSRAAAEKAALHDAPGRQGGFARNAAQSGLGLGVRGLQWVWWKLVGWFVVLPLVMIIWLQLLAWFFWSPGAFLSWYFFGVSLAYRIIFTVLMIGFLALQVLIVYATYRYGLRSVDRLAQRLNPVRAAMALRRRRRIAASLAIGVYAFATQIVFAYVPSLFSGHMALFATQFAEAPFERKMVFAITMTMSLLLYWLPLIFQWSVVSAVGRGPPATAKETHI